jgi:GNAT superfamily N-acetyltransferase
MIQITKPSLSDLSEIELILSQWTETIEVEKYLSRIKNEINGIVEYHTYFWVIKNNDQTVGIGGLADPLPKTLPFASSLNPLEIKILYLDNNSRGLGLGKQLLQFLETEAKKTNCSELLIRTSDRYKTTAWDFYQHLGYKLAGYLDNDGHQMAVFRKIL